MTDQVPKQPIELPQLKKGITISFNQYNKAGNPQWIIHDIGRNKFFIIGWLEHEILDRWGLGDPDAIIESVNNETTLHIELSDIENVSEFLKKNYLIQQSGYQISKTASEQKLFKSDNLFHWLTSHYLFFKIPLVKPDVFLTKTKDVASWIFSRYMLYIMMVLGIIAVYRIMINWDEFIHSFPNLISWEGLFFYFIAFTITKLIHELGHAYMCKSYGVPVPTLGVAFLVFWPVLYTDTTMSWYLDSRQRFRVALAGMWMESYVVIVAALIWGLVDNSTIQTICFITVTVNWIGSLLINTSPFMRFDGYFMLADYLQMPNLQPRAFALTRWQIRKWLFGWDDPPPEKFSKNMHRFLVVYSLITWLYRLFLYIGIALLVYHYFFKLLGIILFLVEIYFFVLAPIVNELKFWYASKSKFSLNFKTKRTIGIGIILFLIFILPIRQTINIPATISYKHQFLYAPESGFLLNKPPKVDTAFKKNEVILSLRSPELIDAIELIILSYQKTMNEVRRSAINRKFVSEKNVLLSDLNEQKAEYQKLYAQAEKMNIKAPFNGVIAEIAGDFKPGDVISKGEWLGDIVDPHKIQIEAFVPQIDVKKVKIGAVGYFYPSDSTFPDVSVRVKLVEALNVQQLNCQYSRKLQKKQEEDVAIETPCYHASDLGGKIPTYISDKGEFVPADSFYRVILENTKPIKLPYLLRGTIKIKTSHNSFASRFFYWVKKVLVEEADA